MFFQELSSHSPNGLWPDTIVVDQAVQELSSQQATLGIERLKTGIIGNPDAFALNPYWEPREWIYLSAHNNRHPKQASLNKQIESLSFDSVW